MKIRLTNSYFVFDLDDTLYKEIDFKISGINFLTKHISDIYDVKLDSSSLYDSDNFIQHIQTKLKLPDETIDSFLWTYRLHNPKIKLDKETKEILSFIKKNAAGVAIITDGRSLTQRKKVTALGIEDLPIYISEEFRSEKPDSKRFDILESKNPTKDFIYVGDNLKKDFVTPNRMGWKTVGIIDDGSNIHHQSTEDYPENHLPNIWIKNIFDLKKYFY